VAALCHDLSARADDWPQWRGAGRDGTWREDGVLHWFPPDTLSIRWRAAVGSGWSSPIVCQRRVYLFDAELQQPSARERIHCFDEVTGEPLWTHAYAVSYPDWGFDPAQLVGPNSTPVVDHGLVFSIGATGDVVFLYNDKGELIVARLSPDGYEELGRSRILEPTYPFAGRKVTWAPPSCANRHVFARSQQDLVCVSLAAEP
jgi:hypothetical protein